MTNTTTATLAVMQRTGRLTLDRWLELNECDPWVPVSAELLEIVPEPLAKNWMIGCGCSHSTTTCTTSGGGGDHR